MENFRKKLYSIKEGREIKNSYKLQFISFLHSKRKRLKVINIFFLAK